jgi:DNA-binding response OmpR family regulator
VALIVLLSDRPPDDVLPAFGSLALDLKAEHLSVASLPHVLELSPEAVIVDGAENPGQAHAVLKALRALEVRTPLVVVVERNDLERLPWEEVADELLYPGAPEAEIRLRLAMLRRRAGTGDSATIRLGPMTLDVDTYQVTLPGRSLDLTYKEFELLRFLASRPGRVHTRPSLLREVWGYDFYGGTRTVDVHIRRLRSKLGPEHEFLIETVRGVGYRAADL